jgi:hypothetical protein
MQENTDLYNYSNLEQGNASEMYDIMKAMTAGATTGMTLTDTDTSGAALKTESLDPTLKILTNSDKHIVVYKMMPKKKAFNTVEQFVQLKEYGGLQSIFKGEAETPQFTDSVYTQRALHVKYTGISGEVSHPFTLVNLISGVQNAIAQEVLNKTQYLLRGLNKAIPTADSSLVANEFDGLFAQHYAGLATSLDEYANSGFIKDIRNRVLTDADVEDASSAVVNQGYGEVGSIVAAPGVWTNYVKPFHSEKHIYVGAPGAVSGATMGQSVDKIRNQFGLVDAISDIFFDQQIYKAYNASASSAQAPAAPVAGLTPTAVHTDTSTKFAAFNSTYWYGVTSRNQYGESAMTLLSTSGQAIAATEACDLSFTQTDTAYASESFVIYRTEAGVTDYTTAKFWPIIKVNKAQKLAGYDGAAAVTLVRDRNRKIPGTNTAMVCNFAEDVLALYQLMPIMRMDLARTAPAYRFMILSYLTTAMFKPKQVGLITNIGTTLPS